MPTEHIYDAAHAISLDVQRKYGEQRHILFTTSPREARGWEYDPGEVRTYSQRNYEKVERLLHELNQEEVQRSSLHRIVNIFDNVEEFIIQRKQANGVDPVDSDCDVEWYTPNKNQLNWCIEQAAPYFIGQSRVDLYAAVSGRETDTQFTERALKRKLGKLDEQFKSNQERIDNIFNQIMAIPLKNTEPTNTVPYQKAGLFRRIIRKLCA